MDRKNKPESTSGSTSSTIERRRSERFPFSAVAQLTEVDSQLPVTVRIADIGRHGCYADTITSFRMGANLKLLIRHSNMQFEAGVTVSYILPGMGIGLNFEPMPPAMESILDRWLAGLNGETRSLSEVGMSDPAVQKNALLDQQQHTLSRLIRLMMNKSMLTQQEGVELLDELLNHK